MKKKRVVGYPLSVIRYLLSVPYLCQVETQNFASLPVIKQRTENREHHRPDKSLIKPRISLRWR
jgi:hypothetical protein